MPDGGRKWHPLEIPAAAQVVSRLPLAGQRVTDFIHFQAHRENKVPTQPILNESLTTHLKRLARPLPYYQPSTNFRFTLESFTKEETTNPQTKANEP